MVLLPFVGKQAEAHHIVIMLAVEMLLPQDAFLGESKAQMKLNRLFVIAKCLTTEFMKAGLRERIPQRSLSKLSPGPFWCIWSCVEAPISYPARGNLMDIDEAERGSVDLKHEEMPLWILRRPGEPASMLLEGDFVPGVHVAANFRMVPPGQNLRKIAFVQWPDAG